MAPRPTVALFNESLFNSYTRRVWKAVEVQAQDLGYRTITLCGTLHHRVSRGNPLPEGSDDTRSNLLLECFDSRAFDGYLFWGAMLNHGATQSEVQNYLTTGFEKPVVSLGLEVPGVRSVIGDNQRAMAGAVRHLIEVHGCQNLLYISGNDPTDQVEIQQRFQAFTDTLAEFGRTINERLVIRPEVLAVPVSQVPAEEGYRPFFRYIPIGDRVCQVIFEDRGLRPGIDFDGIVCRDDWTALEVLKSLELRGVNVGRQLPLMGFDDSPEGASSQPSLSTVRQDLESQSAAACRELIHAIEGGPRVGTSHVPDFPLVLRESCGCGLDSPSTPLPDSATVDFSGLLESAMGVVSTFDEEELLEQLPRQLERLQMAGLYLVLFDDPRNPWGTGTLKYAYSRGKPLSTQPSWESFSVAAMLPEDCLQRTQDLDLVVEVLHFANHRMGYVVFESGAAPGIAYYTVKSMLSSALRGTLLIAEDHRKLAIIEKKNRELEQAWEKLLLQEKLAALGSLVAGVAHEINTPLGVAITTVSMIVDTVTDFQKGPTSAATDADRIDAVLNSIREAGELAMKGLNRAGDLVQSFKQVAADQRQELRREFDLKSYAAEVLGTLKYRWEKTAVLVELVGEDALNLESYPGPIGRVISQLVGNAMDHGFPDHRAGTIVLEVGRSGPCEVFLRCTDNGLGVSPEHLDHLFEPFSKPRRTGGGTGLGLHTAFNLVTNVLGGSLTVDSRPEQKETCFTVLLPIRAPIIDRLTNVHLPS